MVVFALRYYWQAAQGHRLRPWRSSYLRWRMETFFGVHAEVLTGADFFRLLFRERRRIAAFLRWAAEMEEQQRRGRAPFDPGQQAA